ncbi:MAG: DUF393 domain-containing protein [Gemmatimonadota bacterium]
MASDPALYLFYDRDCPLCRRFKSAIEAWDRGRHIEVVDLADPRTPARFPDLDLAAARAQLTVRDRLGAAVAGAEALRRLTQVLPGLRHLAWVYQLPGATPVVAAVYRAVNRHRRRLCLQCGETWMPSMKSSRRRGR